MKHVSPYMEMPNHDKLGLYINESLSGIGNLISESLKPEAFNEDIDFLNRVESMIPEELQFKLHLDMILDESREALANYNRSLLRGKNALLEKAESYISNEYANQIRDAFSKMSEEFRAMKTSRPIFEQAAEVPMDAPISMDPSELATGEGQSDLEQWANSKMYPATPNEADSGLWRILKSLWNGLTEGGSPIGIFQFILDIVGLVGDFFGPVGLIADVINGLIYLYRGKYVLAAISFIAAMIPLGGNVLKGFLQTSKAAKPVMQIGELYLSGAGKVGAKVSDDAARIAAAAAPESLKTLEYISKTGKKAMSGLSKFVADFFEKFLGKLVGWIPLIGGPLKRFFVGVADTIGSFSSKFVKLADDVPLTLEKAELINMNKFFKAAGKEGSEMTLKGTDLIVSTSAGKSYTVPAHFLKGTDFMVTRYGKGAGKEMQKLLQKTQMNSFDFYKSLSNGLKSMDRVYGASGFVKAGKRILATVQFTKKVPIFIGKQVYKFLTDGMSYLTDNEYEAIGLAAFSDMMQDRINTAMEENPNAVYDVPYFDAIKDNEAVNAWRDYQNSQAELYNLPSIGVVGYYARGEKDKVPEEVTKFYEDLYQGDTKQLDAMNDMFSIPESSNSSLRYITPYSKFIL